MSISGGKLAAVAVAGVMVAAAVSGCGNGRPGGGGGSAPGFTEHQGAVEYPAVSVPGSSEAPYAAPGEGLRQLVPLGDCALGAGTYANGYRYVPVNWSADAACTRLSLDPAPGAAPAQDSQQPYSMRTGWIGGGLPGDAVVPWDGGALLGVGGTVVERTADGALHRLADLHLVTNSDPSDETADDSSVRTAVRAGSRLLIGGGQTVGGVESPILFASDDGGATVHRLTLSSTAQGAGAALGSLAAHGAGVVGFGAVATNGYDFTPSGVLQFWHSGDDGRHWTASRLPGMPPGSTVHGVLYAGGRWLAYGGYAEAGAFYDSLPLLLASTDGVHWSRADTKAMGPGVIVAGTVDGAGHPVLVGAAPQAKRKANSRQTSCGTVWVGRGSGTGSGSGSGGWRSGGLGCGENPPTAATTLRDGRVLIAGDRDLWISGKPAA